MRILAFEAVLFLCEARISAVSEALGIDLRTAQASELAEAIGRKRDSGALEVYREGMVAAKSAKLVKKSTGELPSNAASQKDGAVRYTAGDSDYAIIRKGKTYRIYEYSSGNITRELTLFEANRTIAALKKAAQSGSKADMLSETREKSENAVKSENSGFERVKSRRYSIKHKEYSENEIEKNINYVANMDSVYTVDESKLEKTGKKPSQLYDEFFETLGGNLYVEEFGDIALSGASRRSELRHGITAEKLASIEAIPLVLKKGKVIFLGLKNEFGLERIVVSAPIKIGKADYLMGVMLQRDAQNQRLYLHNVVSIKKENDSNLSVSRLLTRPTENEDNLFITSILQKVLSVKQKPKNKSENTSKPTSKSQTPAERLRAAAIRLFCKENISEYSKLSAPEREAVEMTVRMARANGMSDSDAALFGRLAAISGTNIFVKKSLPGDNAYFDNGNEIYISASADRGKIFSGLLGHEMFHKIFKDNKGNRMFMKLYLKAFNNLREETKKEVIDSYTEKYKKMGYAASDVINITNEEVAAAYAEEIFNHEGVWEYIFEKAPAIKDGILDFFKGASKTYGFEEELSSEARKWLFKYRRIFRRLAEYNAGRNTVENATKRYTVDERDEDTEKRSSFTGVTSRTAKIPDLKRAYEMLQNGVNLNTIWRETGWFVGSDGFWRYEIDDSKMKFNHLGFNVEPEHLEYERLIAKRENERVLSPTDGLRFDELHAKYKNSLLTVKDFMEHKKLFKAYPGIENVPVKYIYKQGVRGFFDLRKAIMYISPNLTPINQKRRMLHELQHAIQLVEGFSLGTNPKLFKKIALKSEYRKDYERFTSLENSFIKMLKEKGFDYNDISKQDDDYIFKSDYINDKMNVLSKLAMRNQQLQREIIEFKKLLYTFEDYRQYKTGEGKFERSAGEIEARDTVNRMKLTAEERRRIPPDVPRKNLVFLYKTREFTEGGYQIFRGYDSADKNIASEFIVDNGKRSSLSSEDKKTTVSSINDKKMQDTGVRYSLRKGAEKDVEKALNDKTYREDVYLTENSPSIIASQKGVRNLPMLMKASHIRENVFTEDEAKNMGLKVDEHTHYHGLGKELFLKIIDGLDDITLAYRGTKNADNSERRENYFLLISQYKDAIGNTVNVPIYINETAQYNRVFIGTNKIATVFGRQNFADYINKEIKNGNLVRIKNRSTQASERTALIAGGYSKNASGNSISQNSEKVNTFAKNNSDTGKRSSLGDKKIPTRKELEQKKPIKLVDISKPTTNGTFKERRKQILSLAEDIIKKPYHNKDTDTMIFLTKNSYTHMFNNIGELQLNAAEHIPEFIENAVLTHARKPTHGDTNSDGVYTFFAAAKTNTVLPVKLTVKEYQYNGQEIPKNIKEYFDGMPEGYASSYDTVVLEVEKIEESPIGSAIRTSKDNLPHSPTELSTISISDLLNLVKKDYQKYIPSKENNSDTGKRSFLSKEPDYGDKLHRNVGAAFHRKQTNRTDQYRLYDKLVEKYKNDTDETSRKAMVRSYAERVLALISTEEEYSNMTESEREELVFLWIFFG